VPSLMQSMKYSQYTFWYRDVPPERLNEYNSRQEVKACMI
jgi:hypothetical protein